MSVNELNISLLGPKGDGICETSRGRVFVERTIPGDRIRARVQKDEQGVLRGEVLEFLESSKCRQSAPCAHYEQCGNCTLQHLQQSYYRAWKTQMVREAFARQGLVPKQWLPPIFLGGENRRRVTFAALKRRGTLRVGYYRRRSQLISDIEGCLVAHPEIMKLREELIGLLPPILKENAPADLFVQRVGEKTELVIRGPLGNGEKPDPEILSRIRKLAEALSLSRVGWHPKQISKIQILYQRGPLTATFGPLSVSLPPAAFLQPTLEGENALVNAVLSALPPEGHFADLFSGCGTFSGPMLLQGSVDAFESLFPAVNALSQAGRGTNLKAFRRDLFKRPLGRTELNRYDAVVFDPPRAGCEAQARQLAGARTPTLIGVSCNPATFARDGRLLVEGGYRLRSLQVVDQFLWSHHVEVVGVFTRQKRR